MPRALTNIQFLTSTGSETCSIGALAKAPITASTAPGRPAERPAQHHRDHRRLDGVEHREQRRHRRRRAAQAVQQHVENGGDGQQDQAATRSQQDEAAGQEAVARPQGGHARRAPGEEVAVGNGRGVGENQRQQQARLARLALEPFQSPHTPTRDPFVPNETGAQDRAQPRLNG
ncbi:conserved hypothetical protein [Ricinus communis]|uniref:Uncharacterized protein n=1 Tax=Ricinus communis TaxID=3988 RepID=B9TA20_RICCO|nr:conserved hypothetical protein [Ricinus communis]